MIDYLRSRNAISPPRKTDEKQKSAAHVGPVVLSKRPKIQLQKAVLLPTVKSRMPATEPGDLPTRSLPMVRHVAKSGERPILVRAIARVAMKAFGLSIITINPNKVTRIPSITILQEPMRRMSAAAPRRLAADRAHVILLSTAATAGVCPKATCRYVGAHVRTLALIPAVNIITPITGASDMTSDKKCWIVSL